MRKICKKKIKNVTKNVRNIINKLNGKKVRDLKKNGSNMTENDKDVKNLTGKCQKYDKKERNITNKCEKLNKNMATVTKKDKHQKGMAKNVINL